MSKNVDCEQAMTLWHLNSFPSQTSVRSVKRPLSRCLILVSTVIIFSIALVDDCMDLRFHQLTDAYMSHFIGQIEVFVLELYLWTS